MQWCDLCGNQINTSINFVSFDITADNEIFYSIIMLDILIDYIRFLVRFTDLETLIVIVFLFLKLTVSTIKIQYCEVTSN